MLLGAVNRFFSAYLDDNRFDDYIASPQNGYRALQVTAYLPELGAVEFAIATREMEGENTWAWCTPSRTTRTSACTSRYRS